MNEIMCMIAHSSLLALRGSEDMGKETLETEAAWFMKVGMYKCKTCLLNFYEATVLLRNN